MPELSWGMAAWLITSMFFPVFHSCPKWQKRGKREGEAPGYKQFIILSVIPAKNSHSGHLEPKETFLKLANSQNLNYVTFSAWQIISLI